MPSPSSPPPAVVELIDVHRGFGGTPALAGLALAAPRGGVTVLLGPNGAGKTTAIRVITGALRPDRGQVRTFGLDPGEAGGDVRRRCGVVAAKPALYDRLSGLDNLRYAAALHGIAGEERLRAAAARFEIVDALAQQVGGYSTGMKTRLALARAVLHEPELLLLDEPTSGLDPESSMTVLDLIRQLAATGTSVVMCTHLLLEAEGLADHVVVMEGGATVIAGAPEALVKRYWSSPGVHIALVDPTQLFLLDGRPGVVAVEPPDMVRVDDVARTPELIAHLVRHGAGVLWVTPDSPNLEDLYFAIRNVARPRSLGSAPANEAMAMAAVPR